MQNYKKLNVWDESHSLLLAIYKSSLKLPSDEKFNLTSQIRRSATSIPCNIVEGCSRETQKSKANFIQIAYSSSNELEYQILILKDLGYLSEEDFSSLQKQITKVKKMLFVFLKKIRASI